MRRIPIELRIVVIINTIRGGWRVGRGRERDVQLEYFFVKGFDLIGKDVGRLEGVEEHVPRTWCAVFFLAFCLQWPL